MKYECPSCYLSWQDSSLPLEQVCTPLCIFCSGKHTQKELLNWQIDHLTDIDPKHLHTILKKMYKFYNQKFEDLERKMDE